MIILYFYIKIIYCFSFDNIRRTLSSFFAWLENEDYIVKSPIRRIHKVKAMKKVKETLTDENLEKNG